MQCPKRSTLACTARAATRLVRAEQLRAAALGVLLAEQVGGRHAGGLGVRVVRERVYKAQAHALHQRVHVLRAAQAAPGTVLSCSRLLSAMSAATPCPRARGPVGARRARAVPARMLANLFGHERPRAPAGGWFPDCSGPRHVT